MLPRVKAFVVGVLALTLGCGKSKAKCQAEVAELMTYLRGLDMEGSLFYIGESMHLVARPGSPKPKRYAPVVVMEAKQTSYQGQLIGDMADLGDRLSAANKRIREDIELGKVSKHNLPDPAELYFEIDGAVTWDRVAAAVAAAANAGFTHPSFVFAIPATAQPPPRTWVDDKLDEVRAKNKDGGNLATDVAKITKTVVDSCPALIKVYGRVGSEEGGSKAEMLVEGTGPAIIECGCDIDIPALRSAMYGILGNPHPTGAIAVQLDQAGKPIALATTTPWSEASKQLQAADVVWLSTK